MFLIKKEKSPFKTIVCLYSDFFFSLPLGITVEKEAICLYFKSFAF